MTRTLITAIFLTLFLVGPQAQASDAKVQQIINDSIARYPGNCACPYSLMSNGRKCGKRSAYSKPGGYGPLCYSVDVYEIYPELKAKIKTKNKDEKTPTNLPQWFCSADRSGQATAYQFHNGKLEILSEKQIEDEIQSTLGPDTIEKISDYSGILYTVLPDDRVETQIVGKSPNPDTLILAYQKALSKLDWKVLDNGILGSGIVIFPFAPQVEFPATVSVSIDLNGKTHSSITALIDSPLTLFSENQCNRLKPSN